MRAAIAAAAAAAAAAAESGFPEADHYRCDIPLLSRPGILAPAVFQRCVAGLDGSRAQITRAAGLDRSRAGARAFGSEQRKEIKMKSATKRRRRTDKKENKNNYGLMRAVPTVINDFINRARGGIRRSPARHEARDGVFRNCRIVRFARCDTGHQRARASAPVRLETRGCRSP